ncbi:flagellar hook-length control protein FliK [Engelhardtia mirabilis]|uniref:flagellar hook-length control protein FliK n=1 Tax=Engelhardtia mirabilis TaxID=2528011 RepID=UPI003AF357F9
MSVLAQLFSKGQQGRAAGTPVAPRIPLPASLLAALGPGSNAPAWAQALANLRAPHADLGQALTHLVQHLRAQGGRDGATRATAGLERVLARFASMGDLDGPGLAERVAGGGVLLEARLAQAAVAKAAGKGPNLSQLLDLKAELLRVLAELPRGEARDSVRRSLVAIEEQQLHNVARAEHGEAPLLVVPIPDGEAWTTAWIQRRDDDGEGGDREDEGSSRLTIGIDFSALGAIRADLTLRPESLWIRLSVARPEVLEALERGLPNLVAALERDGRPTHLQVVLADAQTLAAPAPVVDGQLDVSA